VEQAILAAHVPGRLGVVGGHGAGDLRHPQRQPGPNHHPAGQLLIPVAFVTYAFGHADQVVTAQRIFTAFVYGGVLGVLGASVLEAAFLRQPSVPTYLGVGLIEEAVKLAVLWLLALRLPRYTMRGGIVLGAAVGFGFAAFESAGYAFNALFTASGPSLMTWWRPRCCVASWPRSATGCRRRSSGGRCSASPPTAAGYGSAAPSWVVCAGGAAAWAVERLPRDRGVADVAALRHPRAVAADPARPRARGDLGPGAPVHGPQLGAAGSGRIPGCTGPGWPLAPGDHPGPAAHADRRGRRRRRPRRRRPRAEGGRSEQRQAQQRLGQPSLPAHEQPRRPAQPGSPRPGHSGIITRAGEGSDPRNNALALSGNGAANSE
jgi:PrsW family intramembrane metalloprotease